MPLPNAKARSEFMGRLAYYLTGIAIGLVLLGLWQMQRRAFVARDTAAYQAEQAAAARQQAADLEARLHKHPAPQDPAPQAPTTAPTTPPASTSK